MTINLNTVDGIRTGFKKNDDIRDFGLSTPKDIVRYDDIQYGEDSDWNVLDVYHKVGVDSPQPTIVSVHGGGWVYGDKERYQYYCMNLAQRGFTVVNFTYRLAPEHKFPSPLEDLNSVLVWIAQNGDKYNIDKEKIFTVGDSAGGQISSQYLAIFTNDEYEDLFDFKTPNDEVKILACALNCGAYDTKSLVLNDGNEIINSYIDINDQSQLKQCDTLSYINEKFPPSYVMTAVKDFLLDDAEPMYNLLKSKNVECEYVLYGEETGKDLGHVFHIDIKSDAAKICNDDECSFFNKYL